MPRRFASHTAWSSPRSPCLAEAFLRAPPDRRRVLRIVEAPDARDGQRQADQIVQHLAHRLQRHRILILLRVRQQLLQVVEVGPGRPERRHRIEQQRRVAPPDEAGDRRQRRAAGVRALVDLDGIGRLGLGELVLASRRATRQEQDDQRPRPQSNDPPRMTAAAVK